ncbi:hypothetical protein EAS61_35165 [Bradyrhizobium zhanjiangense]|uniref:Uncharacterized protein n=1 Tax=Bradyrhizobium zhanjiangense TaxID=1325107 RepID=A0A4Q0Q8G1_9BRAD|nr:hypothetical protein EAS61_35165 [Bradyrhizobium zhanjiangense]
MGLKWKIAAFLGVAVSLLAAGLWLWASRINILDNIDTMIGELQRIGRVNAWAAAAAVIAIS